MERRQESCLQIQTSVYSFFLFSSIVSSECESYLFEVSGLVEELKDVLAELVVSLGPGARFFNSVDLSKYKIYKH